ncbi:Sugar efflux transporter [Vibrio scophthalmi]|uniref:Sugar efflux system n=1 Tax=Vibrio scophthalmi LMG 19158 TaxID=870967 RepID=F9RTQ0_9VIBR|nr:sugar efflux transporter [Vibrio scophthalmi]ANS85620.1 Sugar efflux transporter [Vibrio scophthalmi]EGU30939.1 sugar efflux system [Vibrio scophthalmi LMG 19158]
MFKEKTALIFLIMTFVSGLCGSFFYPLSSLFIIEALGASPAMLSAYMILSICSAVVVSQFMAVKSDKGWNRKTVLLVALSCYLITVLAFSVIRNYYLAVGIAVIFGSLSGSIFGQLFALGREYADEHIEDSTTFLAVMRAGIAIAWVVGPPIAFILKASFGFSASFAAAAVATLLSIILAFMYLPSSVMKAKKVVEESKGPFSRTVILFSIALVFMFSANNLYVTTMPLYLTQELKVNASWVGYMFGFAALCEIPIMLKVGRMAAKFGTMKLLALSLVSGCLFFVAMLNVTEFWQLLSIQLLNGVFIGVTATLGMVAIQDMMHDRLGTASTLFSNLMQVSMLFASLSVGFVGELYSYYWAFYICLTSALCSLVLLSYFVLNEARADKLKLAQQAS